MKTVFRIGVEIVVVILIASIATETYAQNNGNGTILDDLNRLADEIKEDIADSQADVGNGLAEHDADIKSEVATLDATTASAHELLAGDHDELESKLDQIAETGFDCPAAWSRIIDTADRFELVLDGEGILDHETCLVWEKSPRSEGGHDQGPLANTGTVEWEFAFAECFTKNVGGRTGWRLPTIDELATLPQSDVFGQRLPFDHPFENIQRNIYWSSSRVETSNTVNAGSDPIWVVDFTVDGHVSVAGRFEVFPTFKKPNHYNYWCVRGGQGK